MIAEYGSSTVPSNRVDNSDVVFGGSVVFAGGGGGVNWSRYARAENWAA